MPYDFISLPLNEYEMEFIDKHTAIELDEKHNRTTGELSYPRCGNYKGFKITMKSPEYGYIKGSLHKSARGGYNWDDFTMNEAFRKIIDLFQFLNIDPYRKKIWQLEYGLNINTELIDPKDFISRCFFLKFKPYEGQNSRKPLGKEADLTSWLNKIYCKSSICTRLGKNILRFENHYNRNEKIARVLGLNRYVYLSDLLEVENVYKFQKDLMNTWDQIVYLPAVDLESIASRNDRKLLDKWRGIQDMKELAESKPDTFRHKRRRLNEVLAKNNLDSTYNQLRELIQLKGKELLSYENIKSSTDLNGVNSQFCSSSLNQKFHGYDTLDKGAIPVEDYSINTTYETHELIYFLNWSIPVDISKERFLRSQYFIMNVYYSIQNIIPL